MLGNLERQRLLLFGKETPQAAAADKQDLTANPTNFLSQPEGTIAYFVLVKGYTSTNRGSNHQMMAKKRAKP